MVIILFYIIYSITAKKKKTSIDSPHIFGQSSPASQVWPLPCTSSVKQRPGFEPLWIFNSKTWGLSKKVTEYVVEIMGLNGI